MRHSSDKMLVSAMVQAALNDTTHFIEGMENKAIGIHDTTGNYTKTFAAWYQIK